MMLCDMTDAELETMNQHRQNWSVGIHSQSLWIWHQKVDYHVFGGNEWVVYGYQLNVIALKGNSSHQSANTTKSWKKTHLLSIKTLFNPCFRSSKMKVLHWSLRKCPDVPLIPILIFADPTVGSPQNHSFSKRMPQFIDATDLFRDKWISNDRKKAAQTGYKRALWGSHIARSFLKKWKILVLQVYNTNKLTHD